MTLAELYAAKIAEAKAIMDANPESMSPENAAKVKGVLAEAKGIKEQIDLARQIAEGEEFANAPVGPPKAAGAGFQPDTPGQGEPAFDGKAWRETKVDTPFGSKTLRYHVPLVVQKDGYDEAFDKFLRAKGNLAFLSKAETKALSEGIDIDGGFLVPAEYIQKIIIKEATIAAIRPLATVVTTGKDLVQWPRVTSADDKYTTAIRGAWVGEVPAANDHRASNPVNGLIEVKVNKLMASALISNDLIIDSDFDIQGFISSKIAESFALDENDAFINGNGVSRPTGILTEVDGNGPSSVISVDDGNFTQAGIKNIYYALPGQYRTNAKWVMSSAAMSDIEGLLDGQNRPLITTLINGSLASPEFEVLKGKQVITDEFVPALATDSLSAIFGDFSGYYIVDRVGMSIKFDEITGLDTDQVKVVAKKRVGGYTVEPWRLKVQKLAAS